MTYKYRAKTAEVDLFIKCAFNWIGTPYIWGGDDKSGIDCSGLVQECLKSIGKNPPGGDKTADGIYRAMIEYRDTEHWPCKGSLLFFGKEDRITHTAIAIDSNFMIEAGGGNRYTTTVEKAIKRRAFVRMRPIKYRRDLRALILPAY